MIQFKKYVIIQTVIISILFYYWSCFHSYNF
nr:MAG TPA: hypothetical protein [Caudoviricetes sp.]